MAELQRTVKSRRESLGCFPLKYSVLQFWGAAKDEKCYPAAYCVTAIVMIMLQQRLAVNVSQPNQQADWGLPCQSQNG